MRTHLALFVLAPVLAAQARWTQLNPTVSPTPRAGMIAVTEGNNLFFFGGLQAASAYSDQLWRFDGTNWTDVSPVAGPRPPARDWYSTAFDTARGRLVLFGGRDSAGNDLGDTWEWDGANWLSGNPSPTPSPRRWASMSYDPVAQVCILFGGRDNVAGVYLNDTWAWNGTTWTQLAPATSPTPRGRQVQIWDSARARTLLFGGRAAAALGETWEFRAGTWTRIPTATIPGTTGIFAFAMTYDALRDRAVLYGGTTTGPTLANVWEFDGIDWTNRGSTPGLRSRTVGALAFVPALGKSFLFGGFETTQLGDTWEYQTDDIASYTVTGAGCPGTAGVPQIVSDDLPWTAATFTMQLQSLPLNAPALLVLGVSSTQIPLAALGASGCDLLASLDVQLPMATIGSRASVGLPVPNVNALGGVILYLQGVVFDPPANGLGLVFSARGVATLGVR